MTKSSEYNPGPLPLEYKIIVLPDAVIEEADEGSVIIKANITKETDKRMQTRGTLISFSDMAFSGWECDKPVISSRVEYAVYSGQAFTGDDGREYRIMNDKDLVAFWR